MIRTSTFGLAVDEDGAVTVSHFLDQPEDFEHAGAAADHIVEPDHWRSSFRIGGWRGKQIHLL
jgi:hypothetical protein